MTRFAERLHQVVGRVAVILNDEKMHGSLLSPQVKDRHAKTRAVMIIHPPLYDGEGSLRAPAATSLTTPPPEEAAGRLLHEGAAVQPPPLTFPVPAGATDAGTELEEEPAPPRCSVCRYLQARPICSATNLVASPDLTRTRMLRLPFFCASAMAFRTSAGLVTFLPATSKMTSPV